MTTEEKLKEMLGDYYEMGVPGSPNAAILQNMLGADNELRDPQSENEALLKLIYEEWGDAVTAAEDAEAAKESAEASALEARLFVGAPLVATIAAEMTEENRVYVYVGSEDGYTSGDWYYFDGEEWTAGGVYNAVAVQTDTTLTESGVPADAKATGDAINALEEITTYLETVSGERTVSTSGYTTGMMGLDGTVYTGGSYDNYKYSGQIAVAEGDVLKGLTFRFVTAFKDGVADSDKGGNSVSTYTVPSGVDHVVVSVSSSASSFTHVFTETERKPISDNSVALDKNQIYKTGTFTSGGNYNYILITGIKAALSKHLVAVFECDCVSGTDFEIGFTVSNSTPTGARNNVITITSTKITYDETDYTHGVTIEGRLRVILEQLATGRAKITLMANGVSFEQEFDYVLTTTCSPYVMSNGLIANNCKYTITCKDFQKKIWMFGDSYMTYSDARWRYYLHAYGYDNNVLINCHSGAGSVNAITALTNLLNIGRPKYVIWGIGMNDGADTDASTPSSVWVTGRDAFLAACEANKITPIFCTIPSVPTISHEGKNAWIKASGYKYIDFAKAVGADTTSSWLGTMLSNDGVHPSITGAKSLFSQAISDFPALTITI